MSAKEKNKLFSFSSLHNRKLIEAVLKDRAEVTGSSQSAIIEQSLVKELLPYNAKARAITEELYNGNITLGEAYISAIRYSGTFSEPAKTHLLMVAFFNNISMQQPRFTGKEPAFPRILAHIDMISSCLREIAEDARLVVDLKEDLEKWPELTPIMFCVAPIVANWDYFYRSGYAQTVMEACAEIATPNIVDNATTRNRFIEALKCW